MRRLLDSSLLICGLFLISCGDTTEFDTTEDQSAAAASVSDDDYEPSPRGWVHKSCVLEVPENAVVNDDRSVTVNGRIIKRHRPCKYPVKKFGSPPAVNGWVASSSAWAPTNQWGFNWFNKVEGSWIVPQNPATPNGQLLYLFNGLQPANAGFIIQPVLQWGSSPAGGGSFWAMCNWQVFSDNTFFRSRLRGVWAGDTIRGSMDATACNAANGCNWRTRFGVNNVWDSRDVLQSSTAATLQWVALAALEVYNVTSCGQYFPTEVTWFNARVYQPGPAWNNFNEVWPGFSPTVTSGLSPSCNISIGHFNPNSVTIFR